MRACKGCVLTLTDNQKLSQTATAGLAVCDHAGNEPCGRLAETSLLLVHSPACSALPRAGARVMQPSRAAKADDLQERLHAAPRQSAVEHNVAHLERHCF